MNILGEFALVFGGNGQRCMGASVKDKIGRTRPVEMRHRVTILS